jgi:phosphomannomutase
MNFEKSIFKAYDIRGFHEQLTPELGRAIGFAVVKITGAKTLMIARDMRNSGEMLLRAVAEGASQAGAKVVNIGMATTSLYNFALTNLDHIEAGVMITASHNPSEYNGFKMNHHDGQPISGLEISEFLERMNENLPVSEVEIEEINVIEDYLEFLIDAVELPADLSAVKLVVDYGNGMGALTLDPLFKKLGCEVTALYAEPDSNFPNHEANPAKSETLEDVKKKVLEIGADFGIATDGDGDRIAFIDNTGRHLRGEQTLALIVKLLAETVPSDKVVVQPNFGAAAFEMIAEAGYEMVESRIGRNFVIKAMKESGARIGGESSSHFFYKETNYLESIDYTFLLILLAWLNSGQTFAEMTDELHSYVNTGEINFETHKKEEILNKVREVFAGEAKKIDELDGIRVDFEDWWFIARPSNTEPVMRITIEGKNAELVAEKRAEIERLIESI